MAIKTKRTNNAPGDRVWVLNATISGKVIVEGSAEVVRWEDEAAGIATVVFDEDRELAGHPESIANISMKRRIDPDAQGTRGDAERRAARINERAARGRPRSAALSR